MWLSVAGVYPLTMLAEVYPAHARLAQIGQDSPDPNISTLF
jgi:hypothetical protein